MSKKINFRDKIERVFEALIKKIEGGKDIKKKLDYVMKPENIETSSILTPSQHNAIVAMIQVGTMYKTMKPIKDYAILLAKWTPSINGKRSEDLVKIMMTVDQQQPQSITQIHTGSKPAESEGAKK